MPLKDLISLHFDANERSQAISLLQQLRTLLEPKIISLLPEERKRLGSVGEETKKLINKVKDLIEEDANNLPLEMDTQEFHDDFQDRRFLESLLSIMSAISTELDSTRILHDHDNYHFALAYYDFQTYRSNIGAPNAQQKVKELKQFFNRTGSGKKQTDDAENSNNTPDINDNNV